MSFLRMANFCQSWIANYAAETAPLAELIYDTTMAARDKVQWTSNAEEAFVRVKQLIVGSAVLGFPNYGKVFHQTVDCKNG